MREVKCTECGKIFDGHYNSKYCDDCRQMVRLRRRRLNRQKKAGLAPAKKPNADLIEIAKAAKLAGMSYGEFTARYQL